MARAIFCLLFFFLVCVFFLVVLVVATLLHFILIFDETTACCLLLVFLRKYRIYRNHINFIIPLETTWLAALHGLKGVRSQNIHLPPNCPKFDLKHGTLLVFLLYSGRCFPSYCGFPPSRSREATISFHFMWFNLLSPQVMEEMRSVK